MISQVQTVMYLHCLSPPPSSIPSSHLCLLPPLSLFLPSFLPSCSCSSPSFPTRSPFLLSHFLTFPSLLPSFSLSLFSLCLVLLPPFPSHSPFHFSFLLPPFSSLPSLLPSSLPSTDHHQRQLFLQRPDSQRVDGHGPPRYQAVDFLDNRRHGVGKQVFVMSVQVETDVCLCGVQTFI